MMNGSNLKLSKDKSDVLFNALVIQNFSNLVGNRELEEQARKEGLKIITTGITSENKNIFNGWIKQLDFGKEDKEGKSAKRRTVEFGLEHPVIALEIGISKPFLTNISSNSQRFADKLDLKGDNEGESRQKTLFVMPCGRQLLLKDMGLILLLRLGMHTKKTQMHSKRNMNQRILRTWSLQVL